MRRSKFCGIGPGVLNPLVTGRKFCGRCGRWRHACDYRAERLGLTSYCVPCRRAYWRTYRPRQRLDVEPLLAVMLDYHRHSTWGALARAAGLNERAIRRYYTGESRHVELGHADRISRALGVPLAVIYPEGAA